MALLKHILIFQLFLGVAEAAIPNLEWLQFKAWKSLTICDWKDGINWYYRLSAMDFESSVLYRFALIQKEAEIQKKTSKVEKNKILIQKGGPFVWPVEWPEKWADETLSRNPNPECLPGLSESSFLLSNIDENNLTGLLYTNLNRYPHFRRSFRKVLQKIFFFELLRSKGNLENSLNQGSISDLTVGEPAEKCDWQALKWFQRPMESASVALVSECRESIQKSDLKPIWGILQTIAGDTEFKNHQTASAFFHYQEAVGLLTSSISQSDLIFLTYRLAIAAGTSPRSLDDELFYRLGYQLLKGRYPVRLSPVFLATLTRRICEKNRQFKPSNLKKLFSAIVTPDHLLEFSETLFESCPLSTMEPYVKFLQLILIPDEETLAQSSENMNIHSKILKFSIQARQWPLARISTGKLKGYLAQGHPQARNLFWRSFNTEPIDHLEKMDLTKVKDLLLQFQDEELKNRFLATINRRKFSTGPSRRTEGSGSLLSDQPVGVDEMRLPGIVLPAIRWPTLESAEVRENFVGLFQKDIQEMHLKP